MATKRNFRASGASGIIIPIESGVNEYIITGIDRALMSHQWSIRFFNTDDINENTPLDIPTSGTVAFTASSEEVPYNFRAVESGEFDAADYNNSGAVAPAAIGQVVATRLTLSDIVGSTHFIAQYEGQ